jgi:hypothetical protein
MTPEEKAAYIQAQCACAIIEAMSMLAFTIRYSDSMDKGYHRAEFMALIDKYGIGHNSVLAYLQQ